MTALRTATFLAILLTVSGALAQRGGRRGPTAVERLESIAEIEASLAALKEGYEERRDLEPSFASWRELPQEERGRLWGQLSELLRSEQDELAGIETKVARLKGARIIQGERDEALRRLRAIRDLAADEDATVTVECLDALLSQKEAEYRERLAAIGVAGEPAPAVSESFSPLAEFVPGAVWRDESGQHINAHGGGVLFHDGVYYWFGEHKTAGPGGNQANVGVQCYSSTDLYNWKNEGVALAVSDDPASDIVRGCVIERPKVIHNGATGKFVMWFHLELRGQGYDAARTAVAVADEAAGPYRYVESLRPNAGVWPENFPEELRTEPAGAAGDPVADGVYTRRDYPGGQMARDMTLFVDDDGKAYHVAAAEENYTLCLSELSDDYQSFTGRYIRIMPGGHNEAPALFKHGGKYYLLTSGCTGWDPNAARSAVADSIWGPWRPLGNPCVGVNPANVLGPEKTFGGQSTFVLPVPGKPGAFVAMFDEWRPRNPIDGRYYWLPVEFTDDGRFVVRWRTRWDLSVFDERG